MFVVLVADMMCMCGRCHCSESPAPVSAAPVPVTVTEAQQPAAVAPPASNMLLSPPKDTKSSSTSSKPASDIETSLSSLAAQLGGAVAASENLQTTDFLSAFVQLLQSQAAVCLLITAF